MKFDQLQYFVEAARRQHIGQAAKFLNISPSAISHCIASLEEELGRVLFEKQGRQIKLTHHGKVLLDRAEFLLSEERRIREEISNDKIELRGHYRLAATHLLCADFLVPSWVRLQSKNSGLTATLQSLRSGEIVRKVNDGEIDLGICFSPHSGQNYQTEVLHRGNLYICMGKKHPFLKEKRIQDLCEYPAIVALAAQGIENCESHPAIQKLGISQKVASFFDSYEIAVETLRFNTTWTLLPDFVAAKYSSFIESFVPRGWGAEYQIAAIWPRYRIRTQTLDQLIEDLTASLNSIQQNR